MAKLSAPVGISLFALVMFQQTAPNHSTTPVLTSFDSAKNGSLLAVQDVPLAWTAGVDGDPDFIVGVEGLAQPLCFRLEGEPGHVVRLLQDPDTGIVVNARMSRPLPGSNKTYLSAVLIARRNFRLVAKVGRIYVNRYRFAWGPVTVRLVHGHRILIAPTLLALTVRNKNVTLLIKRHLPEGRLHANDTAVNVTVRSAPSVAAGPSGPPKKSRGKTRDHNRQSRRGPRNDVSIKVKQTHVPSRSRRSSEGRCRGRYSRSLSSEEQDRTDALSTTTDPQPGKSPPREMATYMGFYISDATDLSERSHGLLGQFLHQQVTLQRIHRKPNGKIKALLLVQRSSPHKVKATMRTLTHLALNASSTCWWLKDGGRGVVDGSYVSYLVSRFRNADLLPLPPPPTPEHVGQ